MEFAASAYLGAAAATRCAVDRELSDFERPGFEGDRPVMSGLRDRGVVNQSAGP